MTYLHPIDPLVLRPADADGLCLDRGTESERRELAIGSRSGLSRLIRNPRTPSTGGSGLSEGIWSAVGRRAVYLQQECFQVEGTVAKTRWSIFAALDPERSPIRAVVEPDGEIVAGLVETLTEAGVDPAGVAAIYRDENHYLEKLVDARDGIEPFLKITAEGVDHNLWILSEDEGAAVLALLESCGSSIVADVELYRAILKVRDLRGFSGSIRPVVQFFHQRDFGVSFASTARIYPQFDDFEVNRFVASLHAAYEVNEFSVGRDEGAAGAYREFFDRVRTDGITRRTIGILVKGLDVAFQIVAPEEENANSRPATDRPSGSEFDVEWVQSGIVDPLFPPRAQHPLDVVADPRLAPAVLDDLDAQVAFILNPPPKRFVPHLGHKNGRLPPGSLQFRPPVARGLLLSPFPRTGRTVG